MVHRVRTPGALKPQEFSICYQWSKLDTTLDQTTVKSTVSQGTLIALIATVLWSSTAIFIRYLNTAYQMPPMVLAFWRDFLVFVALCLAFLILNPRRLRISRRQIPFLIGYGFLLALFNALWTLSVAFNGAAVSTVLAYSSPAFTAILGWRIFGELLDRFKILAVVFSFAGCVLVSGVLDAAQWQANTWGILIGVVSGLAFAIYSIMGKAASRRRIPPWTVMVYTFGVAALFLFGFNLVRGWLPVAGPAPSLFWLGNALFGWLVLVVLAVGPTVGGYGLYTVSLSYLPASFANLIATFEPALTVMLAFLFLKESLNGAQLLGSGLIISGMLLVHYRESRAVKKAAT